MFASKPKPLSSPSRVSIEEANSHLKLVHQRVEQLETMVNKRDQQLSQSEDSHRQEVQRLTASYDKHCDELNREIEFLKNKVKELESKVISQKEIIDDNEQKMSKLSLMLTLRPGLDKLLQLMNSLAADDSQVVGDGDDLSKSETRVEPKDSLQTTIANTSSEQMNGFCDSSPVAEHCPTSGPSILMQNDSSVGPEVADSSNKWTKKAIRYREDLSTVCLNGGKDEEVVSTTSTSTTTSGQSPSAKSSGAIVADRNCSHRKSSNSKLRIGRSFNITANFSDDEEVVAADNSRRVTTRRKKVTEI